MRTHSYGFLAALIVGYVAAVVGGYWLWPGKYDAISAWAVSLTGGVVLWYTWETMLLRRAAHAQREVQLRPFVVIERLEDEFQLRNLGLGPALNIKVGDVIVDAQEQIVVRFPEVIPILPRGEVKAVEAASFHRNVPAGLFFAAHLDPEYAVLDLQIDVTFHNVEMKSYKVSERVRPGNVEILGVFEV